MDEREAIRLAQRGDTEIVLREIANAEHKDPRTQILIKKLIDERDILFKIKAYKI